MQVCWVCIFSRNWCLARADRKKRKQTNEQKTLQKSSNFRFPHNTLFTTLENKARMLEPRANARGHEKYPDWAIKDPWGGRQSISSGKAFSLHSFADQCQGRRRKGPPTHPPTRWKFVGLAYCHVLFPLKALDQLFHNWIYSTSAKWECCVMGHCFLPKDTVCKCP